MVDCIYIETPILAEFRLPRTFSYFSTCFLAYGIRDEDGDSSESIFLAENCLLGDCFSQLNRSVSFQLCHKELQGSGIRKQGTLHIT